MVESSGMDAYTGEMLDWTILSKYNNAESSIQKRAYKHSFAKLPTVDHVGDGSGDPEFRICSWRVNDAKHDLLYADFVELCRLVVSYADSIPVSPTVPALHRALLQVKTA